jgi:hypothetical protein
MAGASTIDFTYRYPFASHVAEDEDVLGLNLATCGLAHEHPHFFSGRIRQPRALGEMLLVLSEVVRTHFFLPRPPAARDPVVTAGAEILRLEGFSGCCGVYARADLPAEAFDREILGRGTTNVDFNTPMRTALARLRDTDAAVLNVGRAGVELIREGESVVEKKVKLPVRWIKGFSEVQAYQPGLKLQLEVPAAEARRFLRSLPSGTGPKRTSFVVQSGQSLRLTQVERSGAIPVQGMNRLRVLDPLFSCARSLRIWLDASSGVSGWEAVFATGRFLLVISPELYRGFSGEGQVLAQLASGKWQEALPYVQSRLAGLSQVASADLAGKLGLPEDEVAAALAVLGSRGLAGFDATSGKYFHRELPFDLEQIESLQPRLKDARKLVAEGRVAVIAELGGGSFDVGVGGTEVTHHVRLRTEGDRCTCPWFSKHQGDRGPCKHVLAARMFVKQEDADEVAGEEIAAEDAAP